MSRNPAASALASLFLLAACSAVVIPAPAMERMTITVITATGGSVRIEEHELSGPGARATCAAIEAVAQTMRDSGADRTTTVRCAPTGDQI